MRTLLDVLQWPEKNVCKERVKVSSKFQIVIPKAVRERLRIRPGQEMGVIDKGGIAHLVPLKSLQELQAISKDANMRGHPRKGGPLLMRLMDSSGWLHLFKGTPLVGAYRNILQAAECETLVQTVVLYEVAKVLERDMGKP